MDPQCTWTLPNERNAGKWKQSLFAVRFMRSGTTLTHYLPSIEILTEFFIDYAILYVLRVNYNDEVAASSEPFYFRRSDHVRFYEHW